MTILDLDGYAERVIRPDDDARSRARRRWRELYTPKGAFGELEELATWLAGLQGACPTRPIEAPRAVVFAADHGIAAAGVSAYPPGATPQLVRAVLDGGAPVAVLARANGVAVRVHDIGVHADLAGVPEAVVRHKIRHGSGRTDREDAASREEIEAAFQAGLAVADAHVDEGADLLVAGSVGVGATTPAAAIVAAVTGSDAATVTGRGSGIDDATWMRKCAAVRDTLRRTRPVVGDPFGLLATTGGVGFAAITGFLLQAAVRQTPVVLDGLVTTACALVAQRVAFHAAEWWRAGHTMKEPAHRRALSRLIMEPVLDYELNLDDGSGAVLALPLLRAAALALAEVPTRDEVGLSTPDAPGSGAA